MRCRATSVAKNYWKGSLKGPVFNQTPEASSSSARARPSMVEWKERAITTNTVLVWWFPKSRWWWWLKILPQEHPKFKRWYWAFNISIYLLLLMRLCYQKQYSTAATYACLLNCETKAIACIAPFFVQISPKLFMSWRKSTAMVMAVLEAGLKSVFSYSTLAG